MTFSAKAFFTKIAYVIVYVTYAILIAFANMLLIRGGYFTYAQSYYLIVICNLLSALLISRFLAVKKLIANTFMIRN